MVGVGHRSTRRPPAGWGAGSGWRGIDRRQMLTGIEGSGARNLGGSSGEHRRQEHQLPRRDATLRGQRSRGRAQCRGPRRPVRDVRRARLAAGSEHVKPIAETDTCEATHLLYCVPGTLGSPTADGTEAEIGPGDVVAIAPDHDAWVVGDEPCVRGRLRRLREVRGGLEAQLAEPLLDLRERHEADVAVAARAFQR